MHLEGEYPAVNKYRKVGTGSQSGSLENDITRAQLNSNRRNVTAGGWKNQTDDTCSYIDHEMVPAYPCNVGLGLDHVGSVSIVIAGVVHETFEAQRGRAETGSNTNVTKRTEV